MSHASAVDAQIELLADRTRVLRAGPARASGEFVLCWLTASLRADENPALERALAAAHKLGKPLVVYHGLSARYAHASDRIHRFVLEGEPELRAAIEARGAAYRFFLQRRPEERDRWVDRLAARASAVVVDDFPTFDVSRWVAAFAQRASCPVLAVDSACVVPMRQVGRAYDRAAAFRKAVQDQWAERTLPIPALPPPVALPAGVDLETPDTVIRADELGELIASLPIDHTVPPAPDLRGGTAAARRRWQTFKERGLDAYKRHRDDALRDDGVSGLSPYLHFGMIWAGRIAREARERRSEGSEKFLDELLVWRELAWSFCFHQPLHATVAAIPPWAQQSLAARARIIGAPSARQLDRGETDDPLWDAAQQRLRRDGALHNNVRMTWGKQLVVWTHDPAQALARLEDLNHRYALDGRDPSSYGGLLWCLGQFDRPHEATRDLGVVRARPTIEHARRLSPGKYGAPARAPHPAHRHVLVVGAGIAGLACARTLADAGVKVTLVDKAAFVGGRLASRTVGLARVDHGAPFLEASSPPLRRLLDQLVEEGSAGLLSGARYGLPAGISALARELSRGLSLRTGARVVGVGRTRKGHEIRFEDGSTIEGTDLVLTPPAPQSAELLAAGDAEAAGIARQLAAVRYARCLVGLFAQPAGLVGHGFGDREVSDPLLMSLSVEGYKRDEEARKQGAEGVVARVRPEISEARHEEPDEVLLADIAAAAARHLPAWGPPTAAQLKRWRYARPLTTLPGAYLAAADGSLLATGDAFGAGDAEAAFLNGTAVASSLLGRHLGRVGSS
jgi:hypothetical protein